MAASICSLLKYQFEEWRILLTWLCKALFSTGWLYPNELTAIPAKKSIYRLPS